MKFVWLTDIHLNFLDEERRAQFYQSFQSDAEAILISGDIADAPCLVEILKEMAAQIRKPIYFVLGNHDYYKGQIDSIRDSMRTLTNSNPYLFWLGACEPIKLAEDTILVGEDGWADGRYGDYANSYVSLTDSRLIADLFQQKIMGRFHLLDKMQQLADTDANSLYDKLNKAASQNARKIIVITHVPPFKETARYQGKISDDDHLPFFSSKAAAICY